ncbi:SLC13 family permease [Zavarzinia compransoris]|uniref:SLC13 family permease n=1 Tax=Zavarzinia marina TaxID=2911065 RepID=UPI001F198DD0|nr:SLC13 family permease [Zavarzinia marina]MCF4164983.1 SLC13 family permease [Zavarzinia marina]
MTLQLALVLGLLGAAVVMFALNRPRMDVVALIMIIALPFTGAVSTAEALSGFADRNVILIAALFVIGEALVRTGVAQRLGDALIRRAGASEIRLIALLMIFVSLLGAIMSSTGVVALFIPVVLRVARGAGLAPSRLMMPLSIAALSSGMTTLVATPPNLIVHGELLRHGLEGFGFFGFSPFGLPVLALSIVYVLLVRRWLTLRPAGAPAPSRGPGFAEWIDDYALAAREHRLRVGPASPLAGQALRALRALALRASEGANVIAVERGIGFGRHLLRPHADLVLHAGDILLVDVFEPAFDLDETMARLGLEPLPLSGRYFAESRHEIGLAEVMIPATSNLIGQTLAQSRLRSEHDLVAIGLRKGRKAETTNIASRKLDTGDTLLVTGPWQAIRKLGDDRRHLMVIALAAEGEDVAPAAERAPFALGVLALVVGAMVLGLIPNVAAALIGCLLMGLFGCIDMKGAYRSIHWQSLVLIVGMLPFSMALERSGGLALAAEGFISIFGQGEPRLALAGLFVLTAGCSLFMSNTATAVLLAPVAIAVAGDMGLSPYPFAMTVALAASAAYVTPVSSPVNALVLGPGDYRFGDFVRIGLPLAVLVLAVTVFLVPLILPFSPGG